MILPQLRPLHPRSCLRLYSKHNTDSIDKPTSPQTQQQQQQQSYQEELSTPIYTVPEAEAKEEAAAEVEEKTTTQMVLNTNTNSNTNSNTNRRSKKNDKKKNPQAIKAKSIAKGRDPLISLNMNLDYLAKTGAARTAEELLLRIEKLYNEGLVTSSSRFISFHFVSFRFLFHAYSILFFIYQIIMCNSFIIYLSASYPRTTQHATQLDTDTTPQNQTQ